LGLIQRLGCNLGWLFQIVLNQHADLKQFEKAIQNYNQTIELNPKYASAFNNRGIVHQKLGKEKKAIEDFKKAQELDPSIIANEKIKEKI
jgi:tetratricopeptide (TPR) repeat protein